jgi:hypothetical protein
LNTWSSRVAAAVDLVLPAQAVAVAGVLVDFVLVLDLL